MTGSVLGIDFGTSNSAAGMLLDGRPHLFEMEDGERTLPTSFFFEFDTKETLIGTPAVRALIDGNEGRFMRALKRVLGTSLMHERRSLLGRQVTFVDIIGQFLRDLKTRSEAQSGLVFERALSGRPVRFHGEDMEKEARAEADLRACYLAAGFQEVSFMAEPEAAALASGVDLSGPSKGLIVDIGGGTSDFSLFQQGAGGGVEIIANHGVRIGGTDFDRSLSIECVMPLLGRGSLIGQVLGDGRQPAPNAIFNDLATWEKIPFLYAGKTRKMVAEMEKLALEPVKLGRLAEVLRSELGHDLAFAVEAGKIEANARTQALIDLGVVEKGLVAALGRANFEHALEGLVGKISTASQDVLEMAGCDASEVQSVVYVGGSSLVSLVPAAMKRIFPHAEHQFSEVFTAVADGLAIASGRP